MHSSRPYHPLAGGRRHEPWTTSPRVLRARRRRIRIGRVLRAGVVLGLELGVALLIVNLVRQEPAPAEAPAVAVAGADEVAADPASYRTSSELRVRGRILEYPVRVSGRDRGTFVLVGETGRRLVVVPANGTKQWAFRAGVTVIVRGTVVIPPDSERLARRPTSRTAIAERAEASALIKAVQVTGAE
jgi:hypothetical protein